jgi:hypothetical protein
MLKQAEEFVEPGEMGAVVGFERARAAMCFAWRVERLRVRRKWWAHQGSNLGPAD